MICIFRCSLLVRIIFLYVTIIIMPSCCFKKNTITNFAARDARVSLYLEMPRNVVVFDNISHLVYEVLYKQFLRAGYVLLNSPGDGYSLRVCIKSLDQKNKFVSPDIVLLHYHAKLELECFLFNCDGRVVAKKTFFFSSLISKSRDPIMDSDFVKFGYKRLLEKSVPKIEHFFRSYMLD